VSVCPVNCAVVSVCPAKCSVVSVCPVNCAAVSVCPVNCAVVSVCPVNCAAVSVCPVRSADGSFVNKYPPSAGHTKTVHRTSGKLGNSGAVLIRNKISKRDLLPEFHRQDRQLRSENKTLKISPHMK